MSIRKAFTLVELLVVIAILSILLALMMPMMKAARGAAYKYSASNTVNQIGLAMNMYAADSDDTAPLALYVEGNGFATWYGFQQGKTCTREGGLLYPYLKGKLMKDPTLNVKPWLGDNSGFGYNWGHLGSDFHEGGRHWLFPNCENAAQLSMVVNPSGMVAFTTSSFYNAPWLPGGDGGLYDFGFVYQPSMWLGNPPVDFRHQGLKKYDTRHREVTSTGRAVVAYVDGHVKAPTTGVLTDADFYRSGEAPAR